MKQLIIVLIFRHCHHFFTSRGYWPRDFYYLATCGFYQAFLNTVPNKGALYPVHDNLDLFAPMQLFFLVLWAICWGANSIGLKSAGNKTRQLKHA